MHRFGKKRSVGCTCSYSYTCGVCLKAAADRGRQLDYCSRLQTLWAEHEHKQ